MIHRVQKSNIISDLQKKMVILSGPRQVGKTSLAKSIMPDFYDSVYMNYDVMQDRKLIESQSWLSESEFIIFDELHKMPEWKNYLKGVYDGKAENQKILVTGSARLDVYHDVGDSLAGRYFKHRLMPLSAAELSQLKQPLDLRRLMNRGGFPEPYLSEDSLDAKRWRLQYTESLITTDVLSFENVSHLRALKLVFDLLRQRVGSPVSYKSLAEDVGVSHVTIKRYIEILEALYIVFRITPHSNNIARSLLKEPKVYFFDTGLVEGDKGVVFENLVAVSLLKHVYALQDEQARKMKLQYVKTKDAREVDFALVDGSNIEKLIEVKYKDLSISKHLKYFSEKYNLPGVQVVYDLKSEYESGLIKVLNAKRFLEDLYL